MSIPLAQLAFALELRELLVHLSRGKAANEERGVHGRLLPGMQPTGASAGMHVIAHLPSSVDEAALVRAAAAAGIGLSGAAATYAEDARPGLVFGYATIREHEIEPALESLTRCLPSS
mgnify:FL=1